MRSGAINPNLFGDDEYRLGSLCHPDAGVRAQALEHCRECIEIAREVGSTALSLWLADGTNYPGQDDLAAGTARLAEGLEQLYASSRRNEAPRRVQVLRAGVLLDRPSRLGHRRAPLPPSRAQAQVLVDTGHHPQGTNIEQIVALLLAEGLLGGFHFNNRKYADDDLIVGSIDPFELFRIMREIARRS